ncbi:hypothetical protein [Knoellia subterranea]|uniref:Uncharacterized protein n=1 Tax=Knoellia subterranea KCTC 19937 TaxID=1385521 RepID=A0A0A0JQZ7_9MICO|nr:hypothetical protein [Knoellia subterranea]KGN39608.1 hypothetical protein N803_02195 [Knoellia subterranea KCTC 19937]
MSIDDDLDALLDSAFAGARANGHDDLGAVRDRAIAKAHRIRRRRRLGTAAVSAVATLGLVAGAASLSDGWLSGGQATKVSQANGGQWSDLATAGAGNQAYGFPDGLETTATPQGLTLAPNGRVSTDATEPILPLRLAGTCTQFDDSVERRTSVAWSRWDYTGSGDPTGLKNGGELTTVGFTTGTGADAFRDFMTGRGPCLPAHGLKAVADFRGGGEDSALFQSPADQTASPHTALAVVRVGDLLVYGSGRGTTLSDASATALSIVSTASHRLVTMGYPPALGQALGKSATPPNAASAIGAEAGPTVTDINTYDFGDVFPEESSMPAGFVFHGEPLRTTNAAPVMGVHACDPATVDDPTGMDTAPNAVAQVSRMAYTGRGLGGDSALHITVSGWARGTGPAMFSALQDDRMTCRFHGPYDRLPWAGRDSDSTWLSKHTNGGGLVQYLAAQRVGDVIVAVVMDEAGDGTAATQTAIRLSDEIVAKLKASRLPAAEGR